MIWSLLLCEEYVLGHKTNHRLWAIGTTCMFEAGVPDKTIQNHTGQHSVSALYVYERPSTEQQRPVSSILAVGKSEMFKEIVKGNQGKSRGKSGTEKQQPVFKSVNHCTINPYM